MRILLSNDDGFNAEGIQILAAELRKLHYVKIVAPDRNKSGASSSLTLTEPLRVTAHGNDTFSVNGTPADCVLLGLNELFAGQIDLVISGINAGCNMGDDTIYSGTLAAALEGRHLGLPAIAVSLDGRAHFQTAATVVTDLVPKLYTNLLAKREVLNINIPDIAYTDIQGIKVTRLGYRQASSNIVKHTDPREEEVYWIGLSNLPEDVTEDTDFYAVRNNYVSITPITTNHTAYNSITNLQQWLNVNTSK